MKIGQQYTNAEIRVIPMDDSAYPECRGKFMFGLYAGPMNFGVMTDREQLMELIAMMEKALEAESVA